MAALRSLLQYSDTERKWLFAEDGDVERHLSPAGLKNAAVWRTTETFSAEPFTQGMMDAPDSALGMDLAYLVRARKGDVDVVMSIICFSVCSRVWCMDRDMLELVLTRSLLVPWLMVLFCLAPVCRATLVCPPSWCRFRALMAAPWAT